MKIGEVIRKFRKLKNLTQEEMANRLGVTAPAVNKWENGNSYPDITLLSPIARLLGISLDTLLAFHEELTDDEIKIIIKELDIKLSELEYEEAFQWGKARIEQYPNCNQLIWQIAVVLDANRMLKGVSNSDKYEDYIYLCYERALESEKESVRCSAADSLFYYYFRKEQYEKAEEYLAYSSTEDPARKRKQALIYSKTNRVKEAYKAYEEIVFTEYQMINLVLNDIYIMAMKEKNLDKARKLVEKQVELSRAFEMGEFNEVSKRLDFVTAEKDEEATVEVMERMLASVGTEFDFCKSSLYEHMSFRTMDDEFIKKVKNSLLECFRDEETFGYLKQNERWRELIK